MTIRPGEPRDAAALLALDNAVWSWLHSPAPPRPEFRAPEEALVAEVDGAIAGYVSMRPPTPLESNAHVLELTGLAVDPARRRQGVARQLLQAAVDEARARGARRLRLRVLGPNTAARALYESFGFTVDGMLPGEFFLEGRYVDDYLLGLDLT